MRIMTYFQHLHRDENGSGTVFSLFIFLLILILCGVTLDTSQAWRVRTILQVTADAAAYSGVVRLSEPLNPLATPPSVAARLTAEENARTSLAYSHLGDALQPGSVEVGQLDPDTRVFTPNLLPANAVRVRLHRRDVYDNPEPTYLLGLVGVPSWDISAEAIATVYNAPSMECVDPLLSVKSRADVEARRVSAASAP
jgi:hypothetical protein